MSCPNGVKYVQRGETISLNCSISSVDASATAWFKQTPGENPLLVASAYHTVEVSNHKGFDKSGRFNAVRDRNSFNLKILNAEPSDSATYYCVIAYYSDVALFHCTVLVLKGSLYTVLQPPVSNPVQLGGDTTLQCSILTDNSAGDHSVYWFRHGSGESDPGIIFTHGNRSDQCKKSSETDSPTRSCIYKLPKNNLSLSDAGTYYCAVATCGEIIFGNGTKLDLTGDFKLFVNFDLINNVAIWDLDPTTMVLAALNIILMFAVLFLCRQLHSSHQKGNFNFSIIKLNVFTLFIEQCSLT
uniref:Ig-like domain-containing protein n=1 Tax=Astyanax mexicanus TaxID=7994 RepID=A0A8B9GUD9_ASTMX